MSALALQDPPRPDRRPRTPTDAPLQGTGI